MTPSERQRAYIERDERSDPYASAFVCPHHEECGAVWHPVDCGGDAFARVHMERHQRVCDRESPDVRRVYSTIRKGVGSKAWQRARRTVALRRRRPA